MSELRHILFGAFLGIGLISIARIAWEWLRERSLRPIVLSQQPGYYDHCPACTLRPAPKPSQAPTRPARRVRNLWLTKGETVEQFRERYGLTDEPVIGRGARP